MMVMIMDEHVFLAKQVCQNCLMSDQNGLPRWRDSNLKCGKALQHQASEPVRIYRCQMGFNLTQV